MVIDERLETLALNLACVIASGFTAFVLGMWAKTGSVEPAAVAGMMLIWGVLVVGWVTGPARRGLS